MIEKQPGSNQGSVGDRGRRRRHIWPLPVTIAPTAAFTGSPLSGNSPLTVNVTNQSTGTPTPTYFWWINSGGGYVPTSKPTDADQTFALTTGTYSIKLDATNVAGTDTEEKIGYVTVTSPPGPPPPPPPPLPPAGNFSSYEVVGGWNIVNPFGQGMIAVNWAAGAHGEVWMSNTGQGSELGVGNNRILHYTLPAMGTGDPTTWPVVNHDGVIDCFWDPDSGNTAADISPHGMYYGTLQGKGPDLWASGKKGYDSFPPSYTKYCSHNGGDIITVGLGRQAFSGFAKRPGTTPFVGGGGRQSGQGYTYGPTIGDFDGTVILGPWTGNSLDPADHAPREPDFSMVNGEDTGFGLDPANHGGKGYWPSDALPGNGILLGDEWTWFPLTGTPEVNYTYQNATLTLDADTRIYVWNQVTGKFSWTSFLPSAHSTDAQFVGGVDVGPSAGQVVLSIGNSWTSGIYQVDPRLVVYAPPTPHADFTGSPTNGPGPLTVTFTNTSVGVWDTWNWEADGGGGYVSFSTSETPADHAFAVGTYSIRLSVSNSSTMASDQKVKTNYIVATSSGSFLAGWGRRKPILYGSTVPGSDLTDFPKLLKVVADADIAAAITSGGITVTQSDGLTEVPFGLYPTSNISTGDILLRAKLSLSGGAGEFGLMGYLYYDESKSTTQNKAGVASSYALFCTLDEDPSGSAPQMFDWKTGTNVLTSVGSMTSGDLVTAQVGKGIEFDGTDDGLQSGTHPIGSPPTDNFTIECCTQFEPGGGSEMVCFGLGFDNGAGDGYAVEGESGAWKLLYPSVSRMDSGVGISTSPAWVAGVRRSGSNFLYVNGTGHALAAATPNAPGSNSSNADRFTVGFQAGSATRYTKAVIDECRFSAVARSADWLAYAHAEESDNAGTVTLGSEETP